MRATRVKRDSCSICVAYFVFILYLQISFNMRMALIESFTIGAFLSFQDAPIITTVIRLLVAVQHFCDGRNDGLYVYIHNCSQFIQCANQRSFLVNCAKATANSRLYYNDITQQCDWPQNLTPSQVAACSQWIIPYREYENFIKLNADLNICKSSMS